MSKDLYSLIEEHHAFYEVSPYYLVLEEKPASLTPTTRTIQAGFDVDIFGMNTNKESLLPGPDYALGCAKVQGLVEEIARHTTDSCLLEVIAFPERVAFGGPSHTQPEGMLRLRISHRRGLYQPAGPLEEQALRKSNTSFGRLASAAVRTQHIRVIL